VKRSISPPRRLCELVPAESTAQPAFKIMRRSAQDRHKSKPHSHAGSVAGEDAELSDVEQSESGSAGGRSNATGGSNKKRMTIEERAAAYNEARSRIFMGFEEKEKEKDLNGSSSSLSLVSGSTNGGTACSSVDDFEDAVSSPATESEWSGSVTRDKKDGGRGLGSASGHSSRSLRSNALPFNANGSGSSRGSRAPSPSFTYASLYEPPATTSPYEPTQSSSQAPGPGYIAQYVYPYPPGHPPHPQFMAPYPVYSYPYQAPISSTEVQTPTNLTLYSPAHSVGYDNPYGWTHPPHPPPPMHHPPPPGQARQTLSYTAPPMLQNPVQYQTPYMTPLPQYAPYPMPGYYAPSHPDPNMPLPMHPVLSSEAVRPMNGNNGSRGVQTNGVANPSRTSSRNSTGTSVNGGSRRNTAPPARHAWSYGPGPSGGGYGYGGLSALGAGTSGGDATVGPRLSSSMRRGSGASVGNASNWASNGDEAASNAVSILLPNSSLFSKLTSFGLKSSSTTSSSSRRTYTSTSSHHPLPPRPDWAVGLKPQPTLHSNHSRHHEPSRSDWSAGLKLPPTFSQRNALNVSATVAQSQILGVSQQSPVVLQSADFPPLTSVTSSPEKRTPLMAGAWMNSTSTRSILMPGNSSPGSARASQMNSTLAPNSSTRTEDPDRAYEKPLSNGNAESINPKAVRRPGSIGKSSPQIPDRIEKDSPRGDVVASAILVGQVLSMSLDDSSIDPVKVKDSVVIFPT
jgi:hypothetical protein